MNYFVLPIAVQLCLTFGVAGLLWPEKLVEVFDVLMYPWPASYKTVRINAWGAILLSLLLLLRLLAQR
jgi:hypothetical protein